MSNKRYGACFSKLLIIFLVFSGIIFSTAVVQAGGFHVELQAENVGKPNGDGVGVEIYTGAKDRETAFNVGYEFQLEFSNPKFGQKCVMDQPVSDGKGMAHGVCFSDVPGVFEVYPKARKDGDDWLNLAQSVRLAVRFEGTEVVGEQEPAEIEAPAPNGLPNPIPVISQDVAEKIADLETKTKELEGQLESQQQEITLFRQIIERIATFFSQLF